MHRVHAIGWQPPMFPSFLQSQTEHTSMWGEAEVMWGYSTPVDPAESFCGAFFSHTSSSEVLPVTPLCRPCDLLPPSTLPSGFNPANIGNYNWKSYQIHWPPEPRCLLTHLQSYYITLPPSKLRVMGSKGCIDTHTPTALLARYVLPSTCLPEVEEPVTVPHTLPGI